MQVNVGSSKRMPSGQQRSLMQMHESASVDVEARNVKPSGQHASSMQRQVPSTHAMPSGHAPSLMQTQSPSSEIWNPSGHPLSSGLRPHAASNSTRAMRADLQRHIVLDPDLRTRRRNV